MQEEIKKEELDLQKITRKKVQEKNTKFMIIKAIRPIVVVIDLKRVKIIVKEDEVMKKKVDLKKKI